MNSSQSISNLAVALVKAQAKMPTVKFDAKNPFLKNQYATLGAVIETSRPVLAENGLAITQFPFSQEGRVGVRSILIHESGEYIEDVMTLVPESSKGLSINQAAGVTITYIKRYAWAAIAGIIAEEDNDGTTNVGLVGSEEAEKGVKKVMERVWNLDQMEEIVAMSSGGVVEHADASLILDLSVLPENAPTKTVASWFKHYMKSEGKTPELKAMDANDAYLKAKKSTK